MPSLQDLLGFELRDIAGARLLGEIPVSEALINRLIAQRLAAKELPVTSLAIEAHDGGTLTAHVRLRTAFVPRPGERDVEPADGVDLSAGDFVELAEALGC